MDCPKCGKELKEENGVYVCEACGATFKKKEKQEEPTASAPKSEFTGSVGSYIGLCIVNFLLSLITLGIYTPWAICKTYQWKIENTVINGQKIKFEGTGASLIGQWIKWILLSIITIGIYSLFVPVKLEAWKAERTFFA